MIIRKRENAVEVIEVFDNDSKRGRHRGYGGFVGLIATSTALVVSSEACNAELETEAPTLCRSSEYALIVLPRGRPKRNRRLRSRSRRIEALSSRP